MLGMNVTAHPSTWCFVTAVAAIAGLIYFFQSLADARLSREQAGIGANWTLLLYGMMYLIGAVACGVAAVRFGRRAWAIGSRYRLRTEPGFCSRCGYDLRATPDRCPECGTPVPVKSAAV